jgi:hypothetical protein
VSAPSFGLTFMIEIGGRGYQSGSERGQRVLDILFVGPGSEI